MGSDGLAPNEYSLLSRHYSSLSKTYDDYLYYSSDFVRQLSQKMVALLRLREDDVFVDLGGGTGMYARDILEQVRLRRPALVVDPFGEMLAVARRHPRVRCVEADALSFSERPGTFDKILMKEAVHHVDDKDRLFQNLFARLPQGGILLLVHVPPDIQYPLFEKALQRSRTWHADPDDLARRLQAAGFAVERDFVDYPHRVPKAKYFEMVEGRYMSLLTSFDDDEIDDGLAEMSETYADRDVLEFTDHFDYLVAEKH